MLLGTLGASLLGSALTGKGVIRAGEGTIRAGENFLMSTHPLTNFEIQRYFQNEPKFNGVYSRNNLSKINDGTYIINLDEYESVRTNWIALYVNSNNVTYFDRFEVDHIPKAIRKYVGKKIIITNIYRVQAYDSIMRGYFCIGFIDFMFNGISLLEHTNLFSLNDYEKNDKIILKYFQ